jgi:ADP-ribosyl-[dinitrogen reductase] hydrolase
MIHRKDSPVPRTSQTHPLRIDALPVANGRLGLTLCPGKRGESVFGEPWLRDLDTDLDAVRDWGADAVVTLIEASEAEMLGVAGLGAGVQAHGMAWHHLPIRDLDVPDDAGTEAWFALSTTLHRILEGGGRVLLHCRGGLGRAGTIAALILTERGRSAPAAIAAVRAARPGAVETDAQEHWLARLAGHRRVRGVRLRTSLIAGAIGDSLGAEVEFLRLAEIRLRFPDGLTELPPHDGLRGAITDDTQMTLFTAEGMLRAHIRGILRGICHPPSVVHHALLRWYRTQGGRPRMEIDDVGLITDPRLHARRAPGNTCLSALGQSIRFGDLARNDSKGCGTIMRVAPVALMAPRPQVHALAMETSALTHGHPTGQLAAAAWAGMLADVAEGMPLEEAAREAVRACTCHEHGAETVAALEAALNAPRDGRPETVESLGGGWTAEEALAIALYACLSGPTLEDGLRIAVTHSGDSDSTGAIAGNMLGLLDPAAVFAHPWAGAVECADRIAGLVRDHIALEEDPDRAEALSSRYPGT